MNRRDFFQTVTAAAAALPLRGAAGATGLDGEWRVHIDAQDRGRAAGWSEREPAGKAVLARAGACLQEFTAFPGGIAWYYKEFDIPADVKGQCLRLKFHAVNYYAEVWLNGQRVGDHEGGFTPFEFDITKLARLGQTNRLAVRVVDTPRPFMRDRIGEVGWEQFGDGRADGFKFMEIPMGPQYSREGLKISGMWQPVELLNTAPVYISDVFLEPRLREGVVVAHVEVTNTGAAAAELKVAVDTGSGGAEQKLRATPGISRADLRVAVRNARPWSIEDPHLYRAEVRIDEGGTPQHAVSDSFGLREFTVRDGHFYLNDKRIYIKGAHYQGTYPLHLFNPASPDLPRREIQNAKDLGFNFMRLWVRPEPLPLLDAADELGLLLQEEPPLLAMEDSPKMLERGLREITELVRRDRNRPSIVIWNMINELAPGMKVVRPMCARARKLDPSRLITETAGGMSHYYPPGSAEGVAYLTEHSYPGAPMIEDAYDYWQNRGRAGELFIDDEYGFGGMDDSEAVLAHYGPNPRKYMEDYRGFAKLVKDRREGFEKGPYWKEIFGTLAAFREASQAFQADLLRQHTEAMRANPNIAGYNLVQLSDSNAMEIDGVHDFWRSQRKKSAYAMQEVNQPAILIVHGSPMNVRAGEEIRLQVTLANEEKLSGRHALRVRVVSPSGHPVFAREVQADAAPWVTQLFDERVRLDGAPGRYRLQASFAGLTREDFVTLFASNAQWPEFALLDPDNTLAPVLRERRVAFEEWDGQATRPWLIVVTRFAGLYRRREEFIRFLRVFPAVERGCHAVFLGYPGDGPGLQGVPIINHSFLSPLSMNNIFPFSAMERPERWGQKAGPYTWSLQDPLGGIPVPKHPVYEGLPQTGLMTREYGNVAPISRLDTDRDPIEEVGPSLQVFADQHGRITITTLVFAKMRQDALAERLLANLLNYSARSLPEKLYPEDPYTARTQVFREKQYLDCMEKVFGV